MQSKSAACGIKKSRLVKQQEAKGSLGNLGIKTSLRCINMNEIVSKFLLAGDKLMPDLHLKELGFTYSACSPFTRYKERIESLCRKEIQILFTEMILIKLAFNMIWLMVNQKIQQKETEF